MFRRLAFFCLAALMTPAHAASDSAFPATNLVNENCVSEPGDSEGQTWEEHCGFNSLKLNDRGDRLVTIDVTHELKVWNRAGQALLAIPMLSTYGEFGNYGGIGASLVIGDDLFVIFSSGRPDNKKTMLVRFDLRAGKEQARHDLDSSVFGFERRLTGKRALTRIGGWPWSGIALLELESGTIIKNWDDMRVAFSPDRDWALGTIARQIAPKQWQTSLVLADSKSTEIIAGQWCEPTPVKHWCVSRNIDGGSWFDVLDADTHKITRHETGIQMDNYTQIHWVAADGRIWPTICILLPADQQGHRNYQCSILDWRSKQVVYRFDARRYVVDSGIGPDGKAEFRVARSDEEFTPKFEVYRVSLEGRAVRVGPASEHVVLNAAHGEILMSEKLFSPVLAFPSQAAANPIPFAYLNFGPSGFSTFSSDKSVAATLGPDYKKISWFDTGVSSGAKQ